MHKNISEKILLITGLFAGFYSLCFGQEQPEDSSKVLNDVVVAEKYEAVFEEDKIPIRLGADFSDVVKIPERINWTAVDNQNPESESDSWEHFAFKLSSPQYANINPAPVKMFRAQFKKLSKWKFEIFRSNGSLFRTIEGEGNPPETVAWDGRGDNGDMLIPGHNYAYSFTPTDKAGNKRVFPGQNFSVEAAYVNMDSLLWIGIADSKLFSYDGIGLLKSADEFAQEVASLFRYYSKKELITIKSNHPSIKEFVKRVAEQLTQEPEYIHLSYLDKSYKNSVVVLIE